MKQKLISTLKALAILLLVSVVLIVLAIIMAHAAPSLVNGFLTNSEAVINRLRLIKLIVYLTVLAGLIFWDAALNLVVRGGNKDARIAEFKKRRVPITAVFVFIMIFDGVLPIFAGWYR